MALTVIVCQDDIIRRHMRSLFLSLTFVTLAAAAQTPAPLITNIEGRTTINLDGQWHTIVDPYDVGYYDYQSCRVRRRALPTLAS